MGKQKYAPKMPTAEKLPSGKWRIQVMVNNKRHSITCQTERECIAKAAALKANEGKLEKKPKKTSLRNAMNIYIDSRKSIVSPSTLMGYHSVQTHHLQELMDINIYSLTKIQIQQAINNEANQYSAHTVKNAYGVLSATLNFFGVSFEGPVLPLNIPPDKEYLQPNEVQALIAEIDGDLCEVPILLAIWLGMRRSEILGLCWDCVDITRSTILIRRARVPNAHNEFVIKEVPKNASSHRLLHCPEYIMEKIAALPHKKNSDSVICLHPSTIQKHLYRACERAGITQTTLHGLRHTNAAIMKSLGVDDGHAMERGGWSNEATYKKMYSYVFEDKASEGDKKIDDFLNSLTPSQKK